MLSRPDATHQALIASLIVTLALWLAMGIERGNVDDPFKQGIFHYLLLYQDYFAAPLYLLVLLVAMAPALQRAAMAVASWCGSHALTVAALAAAALALGSHLVYHAHPLSMDEYAPVFQSAVFAEGRLAGQFPPDLVPWLIARGFVDVFFRADAAGQVLSSYWPGYALLLTPFTALGTPWLLNPILGGATVLVMHRLAYALFDRPDWAGLVALLTLASPAVTINAVSFYSMPAHMLANAVFALLLIKPSAARACLAGVIGSVALVLHNPVPHLLFALPWIVWLAIRQDRFRLLPALAAGYLPLVLVLGFGWAWYYRSMGSALTVREVAVQAGAADLAWKYLSGVLRIPTPDMLIDRLWALGKLWLWSTPAMLVLAIAGFASVQHQAAWRILAASALLTLFAYLLVPFDQGHGWGFRYFHASWLVLPLFAVAAVANSRFQDGATRLAGFIAASALLSLTLLTGQRAVQVESFIARHEEQIPVTAHGVARVTIIEPLGGYYSVDLAQNDPFLRNEHLMLVTKGPVRDAAMMARRYPGYSLLYQDRRGSVWGLP